MHYCMLRREEVGARRGCGWGGLERRWATRLQLGDAVGLLLRGRQALGRLDLRDLNLERQRGRRPLQ